MDNISKLIFTYCFWFNFFWRICMYKWIQYPIGFTFILATISLLLFSLGIPLIGFLRSGGEAKSDRKSRLCFLIRNHVVIFNKCKAVSDITMYIKLQGCKIKSSSLSLIFNSEEASSSKWDDIWTVCLAYNGLSTETSS